ncbi:MAG: NAD(P)-dependent oxidoreductase [Spirochaetales bacterium]|nr:NAD(P)-dependent oxidoreductase [Spirochaetales bacterium]
MNIFLTGGTGFIGSYVAKALLDAGHTIDVLARNPQKLPALAQLPGIRTIKGTLSDFEVIRQNLKHKDAVVHVALGWGDTAVDMLNNDTLPSVFIMEQAAEAHVKHFMYTSSTAAFGELPDHVAEDSKTRPLDFYGATKAATENYLLALAGQYPMRCNIIRPGYTFGNPVIPGATTQPDRRFHDIVKTALHNNDIEVIKHDGTQFIYAGDLAALFMAVLHGAVNKQIYLGLGTEFITWEEIARTAVAITGSKSKISVINKGYNKEPRYYLVDKIKKQFKLSFTARDKITEHIAYLTNALRGE